ncbi:amino acid ABC transporter permease [Marinovum sp. 2_MG-2023]|uniref:amino acid ABC transporter permease n=1 Tax=unclassified Marinovum TaxID=2647166 RepID=UPI0026E1A974|nr:MULTISPECIES: amino acid ABC transporter permease [unclassified Marinovum]MDO6731861.1 amino acid ABC transporter permease [Marinovum sp. 2_MG-2023]MDO6781113.1 amino acid ABC transporter permease [Marinovum sp. 1_MG-2023]
MLDLLIDNQAVLIEGVLTTLGVSFLAIALGAPLGLILATASRQNNGLVRRSTRVYVSFWRGTPILVQLLLIFYLLPAIGINLPPTLAAVVALACNTAAFQSEIYRAGLAAVPEGEVEAAQMLALSRRQILAKIEAPQAIRIMLPALVGETLALVRNSSLISVIAVTDLTRRAQQIASSTFQPLDSYMIALILYVAIALVLSAIGMLLERRLKQQEAH